MPRNHLPFIDVPDPFTRPQIRRALALDVDGVLVNRKSLQKASGMAAMGDPECMRQLNRIIAVTRCEIIVSSTWRVCGVDQMKQYLNNWGMKGYVRGLTTWLEYVPKQTRGLEIQDFLDRVSPKYDRLVIIDDDSDMAHLSRFHIKTQFEFGLSQAEADAAIDMLMTSKGDLH